MSCSIDDVVEFIKSCCRHCFTMDIVWGTRRNLNQFLSIVDKYLRLGKGESLTIAQLTEGITTKSLPWVIKSLVDKELMNNLSSDDWNYMLARLMHWTYTCFINPLLATNFYITEGEGLGTTLLFYHKSSWKSIVSQGCAQVEKSFAKVTQSSAGKNAAERDISASYVYRGRGLTIDQWWHFPHSDTEETAEQSTARGKLVGSEKDQPDMHRGDPSSKRARLSVNDSVKDLSGEDLQTSEKPVIARPRSTFSAASSQVNNLVPAVRFVPKKSSVRAITNMRIKRRSASSSSNGTTITGRTISAQSFVSNLSEASALSTSLPSTNPVITQSALYNCLHIFRHIYNSNRHLIGFGVLGLDDIYVKIKNFRSHALSLMHEQAKLRSDDDELENSQNFANNSQQDDEAVKPLKRLSASQHKFYMAVLDLEKCYDNVDTSQLYDIMKNVMQAYPLGKPTHNAADKAQRPSTSSSDSSKKNVFTVHKYNITHYMPSTERVVTKNLRYVTQSDEIITFEGKLLHRCSFPSMFSKEAIIPHL
jgi:hypothetical protein